MSYLSERTFDRYELAYMQSWPLERKVEYSKELMASWDNYWKAPHLRWEPDYEAESCGVYVSISGGKDSEVVLDLARQVIGNDVPAVFCQTGLEYPSVKQLALLHDNVTVLRPKKSHFQILSEYGYPVISKEVSRYVYGVRHARTEEARKHYLNRFDGLDDKGNYSERRQGYKKYKFLIEAPFEMSDYCCNYLKEQGCREYEKKTGNKGIIGTMACESGQRLNGWLKTGCNAFEADVPLSKPLSIWTERDVLEYLKLNEARMMENLKEEALKKGMTSEEFYKTFKHPWAEAYGEIVEDGQIEGQYDLFSFIGHEGSTGLCYKTTGCDRTGCLYCMYGAHCSGDERFLRLKRDLPEMYDFVMRGGKFNDKGMWVPSKEGLGFKFVIDWMNENGKLNIKY